MTTLAELTAKPLDRLTAARSVAAAIKIATDELLPPDIGTLDAYRERLLLCADPTNVWIAKDLHSPDTGELYCGNGRYWHCNLKLCAHCVARVSKRQRRRLVATMKRQKLLLGEDFYFITLTTVNPNLGLLDTRELLNYGWSLFRKRRYIRDRVKGYCKTEEFTVTKSGIHYHYHLIVRARYLKFNLVRQLWTESMYQSNLRTGLPFEIANKDGMLSVKIEKVHDIEKASLELCKYITKSDSWEKLDQRHLLDVARIDRFPRMFELGLSFKEPQKELTILDTESLSDAPGKTPPLHWRQFIAKKGLREYRKSLHEQIIAVTHVRQAQLNQKYPFATFRTLAQLEPLTRSATASRA